MPKAVIFDVDGTLVDSVDLHARAWQDAFHAFGHDFTFKSLRDQIGKGGDQLMPVFLSEDEVESRGKEIETRRTQIFKDDYLSQVRGFPRVRDLVERLLSDGVQVALASSAKGDELQRYKELAGIDDLIETETSSDDAEKSKPHPDIFQAAVGRLDGVAPADAVVVGDTPYDAEAASRAGLRTVGLRCGGWSDEALREAGCIEVYADPADLLAHYDHSALAGHR